MRAAKRIEKLPPYLFAEIDKSLKVGGVEADARKAADVLAKLS